MEILNILTLLAYIAINTDIILQIIRINKTKSSNDLSIPGLFLRLAATTTIFIKFLVVKDTTLIIGQTMILITFITYLISAIYYFKHKKRR